MGVILSDINSVNWGLDANNQGGVVTDLNDINQCIQLIISTIKGTDPLRPLFGCDAFLYIDKPVNVAIPNMIRELGNAITEFEPRAKVTEISYKVLVTGEITFNIKWTSNFGKSESKINISTLQTS